MQTMRSFYTADICPEMAAASETCGDYDVKNIFTYSFSHEVLLLKLPITLYAMLNKTLMPKDEQDPVMFHEVRVNVGENL